MHVICDLIVDRTHQLAAVGSIAFPHQTGRGDGATHPGSPDRGEAGWNPKPYDDYYPRCDGGADSGNVVRVNTRYFK